MYRPRSIYSSRPTQSYHFQADLNWCDGTFKDPYYVVVATKVVNFLQTKKNVPAFPVAVTTYNFSGHLKGEYEEIFLRFL